MNRHIHCLSIGFALLACASGATRVVGAVMLYGDKDVLNDPNTSYPVDPTTGVMLEGLAPDAVTFGAPPVGHAYPFSPAVGDYPGTDQIYVGSLQTGTHDGYSVSTERINGPQVISLDYSALVPAGQSVASLTLGIAADDFQFPQFAQSFTALINGAAAPVLTNVLRGVDQSGPVVQFFSIGISPAVLAANHVLTLSIDQGGDGGDGWAVDFLTVGVTTTPEPTTLLLSGLGTVGLLAMRRRK
jgi:PEP-CTERM motif